MKRQYSVLVGIDVPAGDSTARNFSLRHGCNGREELLESLDMLYNISKEYIKKRFPDDD